MQPGENRGRARLAWALLGALLLAGVPAWGEPFPCAAEGKLEKRVAPEAEVTEFVCHFEDYKGKESLHFKVGLKNVSDQPQRFRVNIFLDNGKAVGGLIPAKGKPPVVQPGGAESFVYPVQGMIDKPGEVTLIVKTLSP